MTTLFLNEGKLDKVNNVIPNIKYGDPVTIEYKRIKLVSSKFDILGKSQIMIVNYVKTIQTKEKTLQSITYYDENVITDESWYKRKKSFAIGPFDPSEYGNPVCFYTPAYQNEEITINTQFWEIDKGNAVRDTLKVAQNCISLGKATPYGTYFEIANELVGSSGKIITSFIKHKEMSKEHIFEFNNENMSVGTYICLPQVKDINIRNYIIENYHIEDNMLVRKVNDLIEEYGETYFILEMCKDKRDDLASFDYVSSSAELISLFNEKNDNFLTKFNDSMDAAYNMQLAEKINEAYKDNKMDVVNALYQHVPEGKKAWFDNLFPHIKPVPYS